MALEKRNALRRSLRQRALVVGPDNSPVANCTISDVSNTGAQLKLGPNDDFPDEFSLILSKGGKVRRQCKVVWRDKTRIGVRFRTMQNSR